MARHQINCWTQAQADRLESLLNDEFANLEILSEDWTESVEDTGTEPMVFLWCDCAVSRQEIERLIGERGGQIDIPIGFRDGFEWKRVEYVYFEED